MLGICISRYRAYFLLFISQKHYLREVQWGICLEKSNAMSIPMYKQRIAKLYGEVEEARERPYRQAIGFSFT